MRRRPSIFQCSVQHVEVFCVCWRLRLSGRACLPLQLTSFSPAWWSMALIVLQTGPQKQGSIFLLGIDSASQLRLRSLYPLCLAMCVCEAMKILNHGALQGKVCVCVCVWVSAQVCGRAISTCVSQSLRVCIGWLSSKRVSRCCDRCAADVGKATPFLYWQA